MPHPQPKQPSSVELQRHLKVLHAINARLGGHAPADKAGYFLGDGLPNPHGSLRTVVLQQALDYLLSLPQHFYNTTSLNPLVPASVEIAATSLTTEWLNAELPPATLPSFLQQVASQLILNIPLDTAPPLQLLQSAYNDWIAANFLPNEFFTAIQHFSKIAVFNSQVEQDLT